MESEQEVFFQCPYCWQTISMIFERLYPDQEYIEDCEVCCRPIEVSYTLSDEEDILVQAKSLHD